MPTIPPPVADPVVSQSAWQDLARTLIRYVEARVRLLQIETREAGGSLAGLALLTAVSLAAIIGALLLAVPALVWIIAEKSGQPWPQVALIIAGVQVGIGLLCLVALRARLRRLRIFEETLNQFKKDRECIRPPQ